MPTGNIAPASDLKLLKHEVRDPARDVHIVPEVTTNILISTGKFADANYITIFDKDEVNVYDANNTKISVSRDAILRGWRDKESGLWRIPLVHKVQNENTDTVIVSKQPTEYLPERPPPTEAIFNAYELKTQPELIRYHHASAGFPTKAEWLKGINNNQYSSWPGLTVEAVQAHFP